jgi:hypothetical protein
MEKAGKAAPIQQFWILAWASGGLVTYVPLLWLPPDAF